MYPTLLDAVTTRADSRLRAAEQIGAVVFVTILTAIAAQISIPLACPCSPRRRCFPRAPPGCSVRPAAT
jgi:hypothetical protein